MKKHTLFFTLLLFFVAFIPSVVFADTTPVTFFRMLKNNNVEGVRDALTNNFEPNRVYLIKDKEITPLLEAIKQSNPEMVKTILSAGASANLGNYQDTPPLMTSIMLAVAPVSPAMTQERRNKAMLIVDLLLEYGADIDYVNRWGWTALSMSVNGIDYASVLTLTKKLLEAGAKINPVLEKENWLSPLFWSLIGAFTKLNEQHENRSELIKIMLDAGANPNVMMIPEKNTPLHLAAEFDYEISKLLIDAGADKNARDSKGRRPFNEALARWDIPTMELLF